jgi:hypothetical protein
MSKLTLKYGKNGEHSHTILIVDDQYQQPISKIMPVENIPPHNYSVTVKGLTK